jgi:hypothetical protein
MASVTPPQAAINEFLGATTRHTRRIEIYEQDGVTRWVGDTVGRLKDGGVTVDYGRDERRAFDMTLANDDDGLVCAPGQFWYDKVIKVFRGVQINQKTRSPKFLILSDSTTDPHAVAFRSALAWLGYGDVQVNPLASNYDLHVAPYDVIVALGGSTDQSALLAKALHNRKSVIAVRLSAQQLMDNLFTTSWAKTSVSASGATITPLSAPDARTLGWNAFAPDALATNYNAPNEASLPAGMFGIGYATSAFLSYGLSSWTSDEGGKALFIHYPLNATQYAQQDFNNMLRSTIGWLNPVVPIALWETQIGEFMIDRISQSNFPHDVKITGRDYTKKCMLSKYTSATQFEAGQTLDGLIGVIATAAGVTKKMLPITNVTIAQSFLFERNTSRWDAMKAIATAYNYEIFFNAQGFLVIRPFRDPTTSAPVIWLETGVEGQVATWTKSTSDASLFNHVNIIGESSDQSIPNVSAQAINNDPNSSTSVAELGDRYWEYSSPMITTTAQAQALADSYLAIHSLEEFDLEFETLFMPWLEAGDILGWIDPDPNPGDPKTFLLSSLTLPLSLSPMSGVGKRVLIVGF